MNIDHWFFKEISMNRVRLYWLLLAVFALGYAGGLLAMYDAQRDRISAFDDCMAAGKRVYCGLTGFDAVEANASINWRIQASEPKNVK